MEIIIALTRGLIDALPKLIEKVPEIVKTIVEVLIGNLPLIIDAAIQILIALAGALIENLPILIKAIPEIIKSIFEGLKSGIGKIAGFVPELFTSLKERFGEMKWVELGSNIIEGIVDGIKKAAKKLADSVVDAASSALNKTKSFLKISSPSAVMRDQVGMMIGLGDGPRNH